MKQLAKLSNKVIQKLIYPVGFTKQKLGILRNLLWQSLQNLMVRYNDKTDLLLYPELE